MGIKVSDTDKKFSVKPTSDVFTQEDVLFCFNFRTSKTNYRFDRFVNKSDMAKARSEFLKIVEELSKIKLNEALLRGKNGYAGCEALELSRFDHDITDNFPVSLTKDTKLYIFRFHGSRYRAIFHKNGRNTETILHFLACDFDFSLYNHG